MRHCLFAAVLVFAAGLVGCSADRQVVRSTAAVPRSAAVIDTVTRQTIWSMDVPVGHTLVFNADNKHDLAAMRQANTPATTMSWKLYSTAEVETAYIDTNNYINKPTVDAGVIELTGNPILIDVTLNTPVKPTVSPELAPPVSPEEAETIERQIEEAAAATEQLPEPAAPEAPEAPEPAAPAPAQTK